MDGDKNVLFKYNQPTMPALCKENKIQAPFTQVFDDVIGQLCGECLI